MYVVDASVVYKWYIDEEDSDKARRILDDFIRGVIEISMPDLAYYEVSNSLRWNPRNSSSDVKAVIENLDALELNVIVPTPSLLQAAVDFAYNQNLTIYDAIYVVLAQELGFTFVTADEKLFDKVKSFNFVKLLKELK